MQLDLKTTALRKALGAHTQSVAITTKLDRRLAGSQQPDLNRLFITLAAPETPTLESIAIRAQPVKMAHGAAHLRGQHRLKMFGGAGRLRLVEKLDSSASINRQTQQARWILKDHGGKIATQLQLKTEGSLKPELLADILTMLVNQRPSQQMRPCQKTHLRKHCIVAMGPACNQAWRDRIDASGVLGL